MSASYEVARFKLPHSTRMLFEIELKKLQSLLDEGEQVMTLAQARNEDASGLLVVSDRRVLFIGRQLVIEERAWRRVLAEYRYEAVKSVASEARCFSGQLTLNARRAKVVFCDICPKERAQEVERYVKARLTAERQARRLAGKARLAPANVAA